MTNFDGAIISQIYVCSPKELVFPSYIREHFRFIFSDEHLKEHIKRSYQDKEARKIGFIRNIGLLRIGVKEQWFQIIKSFESLENIASLNFSPFVPVYAVSNRPFYIESYNDNNGILERFIGRIIVSIYPLYSFAIRLVFKIDRKISAIELINFIKRSKNDVKIKYKNWDFTGIIKFAAQIKMWTLSSIFNKNILPKIKAELSRENRCIYLKGNTLLASARPIVGIALMNVNYENLSEKIIREYTSDMIQFYDGDIIVTSSSGIVAYTPLLEQIGTSMHRKKFRRWLSIATEAAFVVKRFLKKNNELMLLSIKENVVSVPSIILKTFVTGNPMALGRYEYHTGLLKPYILQEVFKDIATRLELYHLHSAALNSMKEFLIYLLTPKLVDIYDKIRSLQLHSVNNLISTLYSSARDMRIPEILKEVKRIFPEIYAEIADDTLNYLVNAFAHDYLNVWSEKLDEHAIGWRTIKEISKEVLKNNKKSSRDLFYSHKGKHLPGVINLLALYKFVEVGKVPSRGKGGFAKKVRVNAKHPVIVFLLKQRGIDFENKTEL